MNATLKTRLSTMKAHPTPENVANVLLGGPVTKASRVTRPAYETPLWAATRRAKVKAAKTGEPCGWFALCDRPATGAMPHPILGSVPICDRCRARVEGMS